jgi:hypothetical protein
LYVISLIYKGSLEKTILRDTDEDAVTIAQEWYGKYKEKFKNDGYIAIDYSGEKDKETIRFAEMRFDRSGGEVKLYFAGNHKKVFTAKYKSLMKDFLLCFLKSAVAVLTDYLKDTEKRKDDG